MDRVYQAPTPGGAFAKMRADASKLSAEYRVGWTSRDTVCPAPTGILWLLVATGLAAIAVAALPPALAGRGCRARPRGPSDP